MSLFRAALDGLVPYEPGKPEEELQRELGLDRVVKLASNEGPWGPFPAALEAMERSAGSLNRYPDGGAFHLRQALAERHDVDPSSIVTGAGADALIGHLSLATLDPGDEVVTAWPSFISYVLDTLKLGAVPVKVPLLDDHYDLGAMLEAIGLAHLDAGELAEAKPYFLRALPLRRAFEGPLSPSVSDNYNSLGSIAYARRELRDAERYFRGNLAVDRKVLGPDHPDIATTMNNLARVLIEQRRFREAIPLLDKAIAIGRRERGDEHADMSFVFANLAIARRHTGRLSEAARLFEQSVAAARANAHRVLGPSLADLAELRCLGGRTTEGLALLDEAALVTAKDYPDAPWRSAWVENVRGECLIRAGRAGQGAAEVARSSPAILAAWPRGTLFAAEARRRAALGQRS